MNRLVRWGLSLLTMTSVATVVLLVTGWGSAVASSVQSVIVANTASNPVPVREQNVDKNGYIAVHEQGTAAVHEQGTANVNVIGTPNVALDPNTFDGAGNLKVHEQGTAKMSEQNLDANGNIKVHEQGIANVNVTNGSLAITDAASIGRNALLYDQSNASVVPAGQRFNVTYVNVSGTDFGSSPPSSGICVLERIHPVTGGQETEVVAAFRLLPTPAAEGEFFSDSEQVFIPIEAGWRAAIDCTTFPDLINVIVAISGYTSPAS